MKMSQPARQTRKFPVIRFRMSCGYQLKRLAADLGVTAEKPASNNGCKSK
jgi:hypothetical protein